MQKVIIRVSVDLPPPPTAIAMEWFKREVESQFPSDREVRNFYAGALYRDPDAMTVMIPGNLEIGWNDAPGSVGQSMTDTPWCKGA
ncbi:MAG: hypothetical protein HOI95_05800 [Chromatiales bacterium]|nr:hypothetical protein [Chromatiales bacterium]